MNRTYILKRRSGLRGMDNEDQRLAAEGELNGSTRNVRNTERRWDMETKVTFWVCKAVKPWREPEPQEDQL